MAETETKEKWYSSMMTNDGVILLKILDEKYTDKIVKILNIHMDDNKEVVFDVKDFPEELSDDQYFISQIQKAIGDIVTQAMVQLHADQAKAEHTIQDIYFTNILKKYHIHSKTTLTTTQIMKAIKLYPAPLIEMKIYYQMTVQTLMNMLKMHKVLVIIPCLIWKQIRNIR